jgi:hypothetical protein
MTFAQVTGMQEMQASKNAGEFFEGLDYPTRKNAIVAKAREANLGPTVQDALDKLPDREYVDAEDLTQALNAG